MSSIQIFFWFWLHVFLFVGDPVSSGFADDLRNKESGVAVCSTGEDKEQMPEPELTDRQIFEAGIHNIHSIDKALTHNKKVIDEIRSPCTSFGPQPYAEAIREIEGVNQEILAKLKTEIEYLKSLVALHCTDDMVFEKDLCKKAEEAIEFAETKYGDELPASSVTPDSDSKYDPPKELVECEDE